MPTGYTACIKDGISFEKFVMQCARAMGACVTMRDEPSNKSIPDEFKPSSYYIDRLKETKKELNELKKLSLAELEQKARSKYWTELKEKEKAIKKNNKLRQKYNDMLIKVRKWKVPTNEHMGLREFMVKQIETSILSDCSNSYYKEQNIHLLSRQEYFKEQHAKLLKDIIYHSKENIDEIERVAQRNNWIKELRESL